MTIVLSALVEDDKFLRSDIEVNAFCTNHVPSTTRHIKFRQYEDGLNSDSYYHNDDYSLLMTYSNVN